jgi:hypothetical protein
MMMISSFNCKVSSRFKEPSAIFINLIQRRRCSNDINVNSKNDKFKQLIKDGPSLGDFIQSSSSTNSINSVKQLKLTRSDDEPR